MDNSKEKRTLMTIKEASEYMRLAPNTLYHKIHDKNNPIPYLKAGGKVLLDVEQLNKWMGIGTTKPQTNSVRKQQTSKISFSDLYSEDKYSGRRSSARKRMN